MSEVGGVGYGWAALSLFTALLGRRPEALRAAAEAEARSPDVESLRDGTLLAGRRDCRSAVETDRLLRSSSRGGAIPSSGGCGAEQAEEEDISVAGR